MGTACDGFHAPTVQGEQAPLQPYQFHGTDTEAVLVPAVVCNCAALHGTKGGWYGGRRTVQPVDALRCRTMEALMWNDGLSQYFLSLCLLVYSSHSPLWVLDSVIDQLCSRI